MPEYNKYLCFIVVHLGQHVSEYTRCVAGNVLKNNLKSADKLPRDMMQYLRQEVLKLIPDPSKEIRKCLAVLVTTIIGEGHLHSWPQVVPLLAQCLSSPQIHIVTTAMTCLKLICEDHFEALDQDGNHPLNYLFTEFLRFFRHSDIELRRMALDCLLPFLHFLPLPMLNSIHTFMEVNHTTLTSVI